MAASASSAWMVVSKPPWRVSSASSRSTASSPRTAPTTIMGAFCKILPVSGIYYREGSCPPGARASRPHRSGRSPAGPLCLRFTQRAPILRIRLGEEHPATASPAHSRRQWRWLASCLQKKGAGGTPALPGGLPPHDRFRILQKAHGSIGTRTRSLSESASCAVASRPDYPVHPVYPCSIIRESRFARQGPCSR